MESHFKEIDQYIQRGNEFAFSNHCGLKSIDFPSAEKLNATQLGILIKAFHNIMKSWNLEVAFLGDLPINRRYARLVGQIDEPAFIFQYGVYCQDFCTEVQTVVI